MDQISISTLKQAKKDSLPNATPLSVASSGKSDEHKEQQKPTTWNSVPSKEDSCPICCESTTWYDTKTMGSSTKKGDKDSWKRGRWDLEWSTQAIYRMLTTAVETKVYRCRISSLCFIDYERRKGSNLTLEVREIAFCVGLACSFCCRTTSSDIWPLNTVGAFFAYLLNKKRELSKYVLLIPGQSFAEIKSHHIFSCSSTKVLVLHVPWQFLQTRSSKDNPPSFFHVVMAFVSLTHIASSIFQGIFYCLQ